MGDKCVPEQAYQGLMPDVAGVTGAPQPDVRLIGSFPDLCQIGKKWPI